MAVMDSSVDGQAASAQRDPAMSEDSMSSLPLELLIHIVRYLDTKDISMPEGEHWPLDN